MSVTEGVKSVPFGIFLVVFVCLSVNSLASSLTAEPDANHRQSARLENTVKLKWSRNLIDFSVWEGARHGDYGSFRFQMSHKKIPDGDYVPLRF